MTEKTLIDCHVHLAEDAAKPAISLLAVEALASQTITDINIMHYFNYLSRKLLSCHYIDNAVPIGMDGT
jgi:hypothetical protein